MNLIDKKLNDYLESMDDQAVAGIIRVAMNCHPEDKRRDLIIKLIPVAASPQQKVHIKYDQNHNGKFSLMFGDETAQDNFETTKDAATWGTQNGYIVIYPEEKLWNVPVMRIGYGHHLVAVSARSEQEAIDKAIDEAGGESFSEKSSEYEAPDGAHLID